MQRKVVLALALALCLGSYAQAALQISVGDFVVPDPGVGVGVIDIPINVTGDGDLIAGTDLHVQIGPNGNGVDGIPGNGDDGGTPPNPTITYVGAPGLPTGGFMSSAADGSTVSNAFTNSFNINKAININLGSNPVTGDPELHPVVASGLLFTLRVTYTGFHSGTYPLLLSGAGINGPTDFFDIDANFVNTTVIDGSLKIQPIPEPSSIVLGLFAVAGLAAVAIRKRRAA